MMCWRRNLYSWCCAICRVLRAISAIDNVGKQFNGCRAGGDSNHIVINFVHRKEICSPVWVCDCIEIVSNSKAGNNAFTLSCEFWMPLFCCAHCSIIDWVFCPCTQDSVTCDGTDAHIYMSLWRSSSSKPDMIPSVLYGTFNVKSLSHLSKAANAFADWAQTLYHHSEKCRVYPQKPEPYLAPLIL